MSPMICSSVDPLPSSPAQEALDLLFNCGSTEEASSSPGRGPLTEAELALFDPFSKEGNKLGQVRGGARGGAGQEVLRGREAEAGTATGWPAPCPCKSEKGGPCGRKAALVRIRSSAPSPALASWTVLYSEQPRRK